MRADSGLHRGFGHVMRCITLGQELIERGYRVTLVGSEIHGLPVERARRAQISISELTESVGDDEAVGAIANMSPDILVLDSYDLSRHFFDLIDELETPYVVFDDNGDVKSRRFEVLINQNVHAQKSMYPNVDEDRLLLGCQFAMIRREVLNQPSQRSLGKRGRPRVLVALGGTDVRGLTRSLADALLSMGEVELTVAGRDVPDGAEAAPTDISQALSQSDVAIVAAGSTMWETCFLGIPTVALIVADSQLAASLHLAEIGVIDLVDCRENLVVENLCDQLRALLNDRIRQQEMSQTGRRLIDGLGVRRVVDRLERVLS